MQYVVQRRNALGGLEWLAEFADFSEAREKCKEINSQRGRPYKAYPAYIFDTRNNRAIHVKHNRGHYWCIWIGGPNYSVGDAEYFTSIQSIKDELVERLNNHRMYPCVDETSYFECYNTQVSDYPDFIVKFSTKGNPITEQC